MGVSNGPVVAQPWASRSEERRSQGSAAKRLSIFRDQQPFQNIAGLSDRALLRLGHAYAFIKDWDANRAADIDAAK